MPYLLDTNTVIYARDGAPEVLAKFAQHDGSLVLSALCLAELQGGRYRSSSEADLRQARLEILLSRIPVLAFDTDAALEYRRILVHRGWSRGRAFDRMIAAHAISEGCTLVTNNRADFSDVPGLVLENWVNP